MSYLNNDEMLGTVQNRFAAERTLEVTKKEGVYTAFMGGHRSHADCLNVEGAASGMADGSTLEFGGTKEKRVTATVTPSGKRYLYVEVGE